MSWIDLAAMTLVLWSTAKGYLFGGYRMFLHCCGLVIALGVALYLQQPFSAYLNQEWQAEAILVGIFTKNSNLVLETGVTGSPGVMLPSLSGVVMQRLLPQEQLLPAASGEVGLTVMAAMLVKALAVFVFFVFIAAIITLLIRIKNLNNAYRNMSETQRMIGALLGALYGLALSMVLCLALDALSMLTFSGFWQQDLSVSYLAQILAYLLQYI